MTEEQRILINKLLTEKYFTQRDADNLSFVICNIAGIFPKYFIRLNKPGNLSDSTADRLIRALKKAPTKIEAEGKEADSVTALMRHEELVEWAKDRGLKVRARMKSEDLHKAIYAAGLEPPAELRYSSV
jgi:hypothetical protein